MLQDFAYLQVIEPDIQTVLGKHSRKWRIHSETPITSYLLCMVQATEQAILHHVLL